MFPAPCHWDVDIISPLVFFARDGVSFKPSKGGAIRYSRSRGFFAKPKGSVRNGDLNKLRENRVWAQVRDKRSLVGEKTWGMGRFLGCFFDG